MYLFAGAEAFVEPRFTLRCGLKMSHSGTFQQTCQGMTFSAEGAGLQMKEASCNSSLLSSTNWSLLVIRRRGKDRKKAVPGPKSSCPF